VQAATRKAFELNEKRNPAVHMQITTIGLDIVKKRDHRLRLLKRSDGRRRAPFASSGVMFKPVGTATAPRTAERGKISDPNRLIARQRKVLTPH
jgi:hypothetical protein